MKRQRHRKTGQPSSNRRGAVLVVVMICALLASIILGTLLRMAATGRRQSRVHTRSLQAAWLAESGVERAAAKLATNPNYEGETWSVSAEELNGQHAGIVEIKLNPLVGQAAKRDVLIQADFPAGDQQRIRKSKHVVMNIPSSSSPQPEDVDE